MQRSDAAFTGSVPEIYDTNLGPMLFEPYAHDMTERVRTGPAARILETAAGTGRVTRVLAAAFPDAHIVATDLNAAMIARAQATFDAANVTWHTADMLALPFDDGSFDVVVCQFGVMFVPNKVAAYREALRALSPGGRYLFNVWDGLATNPIPETICTIVETVLPPGERPFMERTPHGHGDPAAIERDLRAAGFARIDITPIERRSRCATARQPAVGIVQGSRQAAQADAARPGCVPDVIARVEQALIARFGDGPIDAPMRAFVIEARR